MNILNSMLGSIQESLKSTEATLTSSHPKTSFNPSKSSLQLLSLTTCEPDVHHGQCYSTTRSTNRVLPLAPSGVPYHSLKSFVLYSLCQLCSTTSTRFSILAPLLDPKYEPIQVSSIPAATNSSAGALSGPPGVWSTAAPVIPQRPTTESAPAWTALPTTHPK